MILGGPVLHLAGNSLFKHSLLGYVPWSRLIGILALAVLIPFAVAVNRLVLSAGATLVVATLAAATGTPPVLGRLRPARRAGSTR